MVLEEPHSEYFSRISSSSAESVPKMYPAPLRVCGASDINPNECSHLVHTVLNKPRCWVNLKRLVACFRRNISMSLLCLLCFTYSDEGGWEGPRRKPLQQIFCLVFCFLEDFETMFFWRFWNNVFCLALLPYSPCLLTHDIYFFKTCLFSPDLSARDKPPPFLPWRVSNVNISIYWEKKWSPDIWCWQISKYTASSKLAGQQWTFTHMICCRQILSFMQIQKYWKLQIQMPLLLPDLSASNEPPPHLLPTQPLFPGGRHLAHSCQHKISRQ